MKTFWDERYAQETYVYGTEPNAFFKQCLDGIAEPGKLLLPAEGEGRNAVYAAKKGWQVTALDQSEQAKTKALQLAENEAVELNYLVGDISEVHLTNNSFDLIALIYAHFPPSVRSSFHRQLTQSLKSGGILILEAFNPHHLAKQAANPSVGGPKTIEMLYSPEMLRNDFPDFEVIELTETEIDLQEGMYHQGNSAVIRMLARKK